MGSYKDFLKPNRNIIERFNKLWNPECSERKIQLFENDNDLYEIDETMIPGIDFFEEGDNLLNTVFAKIRSGQYCLHDVETAVFLLDGIYHTYMRNHLQIAKKLHYLLENRGLWERIVNTKDVISESDLEAIKSVDAIAQAGKLIDKRYYYNYSFATKFCHWIKPNCFPIYDSIACGLLAYYLKADSNACCVHLHPNLLTKKKGKTILDIYSFGTYSNYVEAYRLFREIYHIEECTIKQLDIFLWTYGKALESKTVKYKIAESITYKPLLENEIIDSL